jgi:hypothetical protein
MTLPGQAGIADETGIGFSPGMATGPFRRLI